MFQGKATFGPLSWRGSPVSVSLAQAAFTALAILLRQVLLKVAILTLISTAEPLAVVCTQETLAKFTPEQ